MSFFLLDIFFFHYVASHYLYTILTFYVTLYVNCGQQGYLKVYIETAMDVTFFCEIVDLILQDDQTQVTHAFGA